jgi:hypothetical protein
MARKATNPKNLKPFKKGQSGNPAGRPPKLPGIDEIIAKVMSETDAEGHTRTEKILRKMAIKAETDCRAAELTFERSYGKVKNITDLSLNIEQLTENELDLIIGKLLKTEK